MGAAVLREDLQVGLDRGEDVALEEGEQYEEHHRLPEFKKGNLTAET